MFMGQHSTLYICRSAISASTSYTGPTTSYPSWPAGPARRSSTPPVSTNGFPPPTIPPVPFAEICSRIANNSIIRSQWELTIELHILISFCGRETKKLMCCCVDKQLRSTPCRMFFRFRFLQSWNCVHKMITNKSWIIHYRLSYKKCWKKIKFLTFFITKV